MYNFLLIEDEDAFAENLLSDLAELGATTKRASSGEEGLELLKKNNYDGLILDLHLGNYPDLQGLQILEWLNKNKKSIVVIVVTGNQHLVFRALELGVDGWLPKPVNSQHVLQYLIRAVDSRNLKIENTKLKKKIKFILSSNIPGYIFSLFILLSIFIWRQFFPEDWIGLVAFFIISVILLIGNKRISKMALSFLGQKLEIDTHPTELIRRDKGISPKNGEEDAK